MRLATQKEKDLIKLLDIKYLTKSRFNLNNITIQKALPLTFECILDAGCNL